jgi:hypothetical protein
VPIEPNERSIGLVETVPGEPDRSAHRWHDSLNPFGIDIRYLDVRGLPGIGRFDRFVRRRIRFRLERVEENTGK